jgi:gas vesicle protein
MEGNPMNEHPQDLGRGNGAAIDPNGSRIMMGFIVGAAVGAGVALLLAPATGAETRRRLSRTASRFSHGMGELKNELGTAVAAGREAFAHEREAHASHVSR